MEETMRTLMLTAAATLAIATAPGAVMAQNDPRPAPAAQAAAAATPAPETAAEANKWAMPGPPTEETIPASAPGQPETIVTTYPSNLTPPPAAALNKTYPLCSRTLHDGCRNRGEGGAQTHKHG
jgi:hypothetical protein